MQGMSAVSPRLCQPSCPCAGGCTTSEALAQCEAYPKLQDALQQYFQFTAFRPGQLEALLPVLHGKDAFVRIATGGGKSMCIFLVPLSIGNGAVGVVISPLNGLMDEQVSLNSGGVAKLIPYTFDKFHCN